MNSCSEFPQVILTSAASELFPDHRRTSTAGPKSKEHINLIIHFIYAGR